MSKSIYFISFPLVCFFLIIICLSFRCDSWLRSIYSFQLMGCPFCKKLLCHDTVGKRYLTFVSAIVVGCPFIPANNRQFKDRLKVFTENSFQIDDQALNSFTNLTVKLFSVKPRVYLSIVGCWLEWRTTNNYSWNKSEVRFTDSVVT